MSRKLRSVLPAALAALTLAVGVSSVSAQSGATVQQPYALGARKTKQQPYNYTGRLFSLGDAIGFGSGTLIRRHTVLTAGHVLYDPTVGFTSSITFTRALYGNYSLSKGQVVSVATLTGYQAAVDRLGDTSPAAFQLDQGYVLIGTAPVDGSWANFVSTPSLLTNPSNQFFVLGYPGVTFDGRTLAYIVPSSEYTAVGTSATTGSYNNDSYIAEPGMSGGPVYVVLNNDPNQRYVAADTVGGIDDSSGEFNTSFVRAIDSVARKFLSAAEYTFGLIKQAKVTGETTVRRGGTYTYTVVPVFSDNGTTDRYTELKLKNTVAGIAGQGKIVIKKTSNTTFNVTIPTNSTTIRSGATVTLQAYYQANTPVPGASSITLKIQ